MHRLPSLILLAACTSDGEPSDSDPRGDTDPGPTDSFGPYVCSSVETEPGAGGRRVFVSPTGSDDADGSSESNAVATLARAQSLAKPGDVIFLAPGATFFDTITFGQGQGGRAGAPLVLSSSSTNPAKLVATASGVTPITIYNAGHVVVENLIVEGPGKNLTKAQGVRAFSDEGRYASLVFRNLNVSGFHEGLVVWSWERATDGFDDVLIEDVDLHHNLQGGGSFYGLGTSAHRDVVVRCSSFSYNTGDPALTRPSGDGFVLGSVTNGLIDGCVAHHNGGDGNNSAGPVGLWAYNASKITIQFSESYNNLAKFQDGDGFDLDIGVTDSVIQYCYSHDNFGAGYLLSQQGTEPWGNNVIRYNISENDGWGKRLGALTYYSEPSALGLEDSWVYGNTVYSSVGPVVNLTSADNAGRNYLFNNIFVAAGGQALVWDWSGDAGAGKVISAGNLWWDADGSPDFQGRSSLQAWRDALGQEMRDGTSAGVYADPLLEAPGSGGTLGDVTRLRDLTAYRLRLGSPALDAGVDPMVFGQEPGPHDYYGGSLPNGVGYDLGAHEANQEP
jgi:hypothetical protein